MRTRGFKSFSTMKDAFLKLKRFSCQASTIRRMNCNLSILCRGFKSTIPRELKPESYREWLLNLELEPASISKIHSDSIAMLKWSRHPEAETLALLRVPVPEKAIKTYTDQELKIILNWIFNNANPKATFTNHRLACFLGIVLTSGMRPAECCSLRWSDWHAEKSMFRLLKTKTREARWAAVLPMMNPIIEGWKERSSSLWVMPSAVLIGQPVLPSSIRNRLAGLRELLRLEVLNAKTFRSTLVKRVIESGGSFEDAAAVVGHASIETTRKHYHRITMNSRAKEAHTNAWKDLQF